jgi:uncharacterized membrane-anchored protein YitT (DUF2179 family)
VSDTVRARSPRSHISLNDDGQRHPRENALAVFTLVTGIPAFILGFIVVAHFPAVVLGLLALFVGLFDQMISATRNERIVIMTGVVAAFVGVGLGFAHGGFGL